MNYLQNWKVPRHAYQSGAGLRAAVMDYLVTCGLDPSLIAAQLCALGGVVTQFLANIRWPNGQHVVVGNSTYLVDQSGGGKSLGAKLIMGPTREFLDTLDLPQSEEPIAIVEDATREAVLDAMAEAHSVALVSTEGKLVIPLLRSGGATLIKLMDAEGLKHARRSLGGRISIGTDRRFSFHVAIQPGLSADFMDWVRSSQGDAGIQNRTEFFDVPATASMVNPAHHVDPAAPALRACALRSMELLRASVTAIYNKSVRPNLNLSTEAAKFLVEVDQEARSTAQSQSHPYLRTYLLRHAERALREAGSHHVFEHGPEGEVDLASMQIADQLGRDSFQTFERLTYRPPKVTKQEVNADRVERLVAWQVRCNGLCLSVAKLRGLAVNAGLTRAQFDSALPLMCAAGKAYVDGDVLHVHPFSVAALPRM